MKKIIVFFIAVGIVLYAAYEALMYYDNNFRYGRMRETPAVRPLEEPMPKMAAGIVPINGGEAFYRAADAATLEAPIDIMDPADVTRGKAVYFTFCAQCHGIAFDGNGTVGQSFHPLPTDLRSALVQSKLPGELFKSVSYGVPGGRQPPLQTTITIEDRWRVVGFIKSLGIRN